MAITKFNLEGRERKDGKKRKKKRATPREEGPV
jgi:hypothetical protein